MKIEEDKNFTRPGVPVDYDPFAPGEPVDYDPFGSEEPVDYDPFKIELEAVVPVTAMQMEIWLSTQMGDDASCAYNESCKLYMKGPLDRQALHDAIQEVVQRHQSLRATFSSNGEHMCIAKTVVIDLPEDQLPDDDRFEEAIKQAVAAEVSIAFDLQQGPLLKVRLLHKNNQEHYLLFTAHHIVCDGWSLEVIINDLGEFYTAHVNGQTCELDSPPQYGEYATASGSESEKELQRRDHEYWIEVLSGQIPNLDLPLDKPRPAHRSFSSARVEHTLPPHLVKRLQHFGADRHASLFVVLLTAFQVLLYRLTNQTDIITGVPYAGHLQPGLAHLVGHCVNVLPIRGRLDGTGSFINLLEQLRQSMLTAQEHSKCSFGSLIPELNITRQANRIPLVWVLFGFYKMDERTAKNYQDLQIKFSINPRTKENFELFVSTIEIQGEVVFQTQYNADIFDGETIVRWMKAFEVMLYAVLENPDKSIAQLPILDEAELKLLRNWNETKMSYRKDVCLHQLFVERATVIPLAEVAQDESRVLTYAELDSESDRLAAYLVNDGVKIGDFVGICMGRSVDMIVGVLGILKSGAAYVPLDPAFPKDRIQFMIEDAAVKRIVTEKQYKGAYLGNLLPNDALICFDQMNDIFQNQDCGILKDVMTKPEDNAYVIYTSGSTGKPKGVQVPHRAVVNFLTSMAEKPGMTEEDVLLAVTTLSFDIAVLELYLPLLVGARTVIASHEMATDGKRLLEAIERYGITMMQATPTTWRLMLTENWKSDAKIKILCGGEPFPRDLLQDILPRASSVWNMYGPTETTVWSTCCQLVDAESNIHIGKPIGNTQTYIITESMQLAPIGVTGELYIGGDGVTLGYLNRPELTADRFVKNPFHDDGSGLVYATGDLARMLPDGNIECFGRIDKQIKLRGFRIELGEIEATLLSHDKIKDAAVDVREYSAMDKRLLAYVVLVSGASLTANEIREFVSAKLPQYMIPAAFIFLEEIPLTPNGKINRKALPEPDSPYPELASTFVAPCTPTEETVANIFSEVLGLQKVGTCDNFFELGGHSLLAVKVRTRLSNAFHLEMSLRDFFEAPTVARLALFITQKQAHDIDPEELGRLLKELEETNTDIQPEGN